jgi:hypothetical protein
MLTRKRCLTTPPWQKSVVIESASRRYLLQAADCVDWKETKSTSSKDDKLTRESVYMQISVVHTQVTTILVEASEL